MLSERSKTSKSETTMSINDPRQDVPGPEKDQQASWKEKWISERVLDPAVLARMANQFFTALPDLVQATIPVSVPDAADASTTVARVAAETASLPTENELRSLPTLRSGLTDSPIAFDATGNPTPWIPAVPGEFAEFGSVISPSLSFLKEARPIFARVSSAAALPMPELPVSLRELENSAAAHQTIHLLPNALPGGAIEAPPVPGAPIRPEATERTSDFGFLNETRRLFPPDLASFPEPEKLDPDALPDLSLSSREFEVWGIRRDFPILEERVNGRPLVWFDNAATTQKPQAVIDRLSAFYSHENSNIHRAAHELAARATDAYEGARDKVRRFLNASTSREIIFVRGATEGINLVAQSWGRQNIGKDDEIVITWLEHHANIVPWQMLCSEKGARLRVAPVDDTGQVLLDEYTKLVGPRTRLVSFAQVSNALGTVTPAREMIEIAHRHGAKVLLDGAQAVSHMPVDVQLLDCDFYVLSGHKIFAPTGIGVVYGKSDILEHSPPWQGGGSMILDVTFEKTIYNVPPARFEAGTGSIGDAVGLGAAIDYVQRLGMANIARYEHDLLVYATEGLLRIPGLRLIGTAKEKASVLSFVVDGFRTEDIGAALNREGIAVRAGHHCAQPIHRRFGIESTVRASLALYNTCEEVDALVAALWNLQQGHRSSFS
jgi:cysteine desulfurase / selenocysteine lyase